MAGTYRAEHRGKLFNLIWPFTRWLVTMVTATLGVVLLFILNRTIVIGRRRVPEERNLLLLSNHQSMIDGFVVGVCAFYPQAWWKPWLLPWTPAAEENFYHNPLMAWLSDQWKCIPVEEGRRDLRALHRMMHAIQDGVMIVFPEGTRSRDGRILPGRPGAGLLTLGARPTVIPVTIEGMQDVLPVGAVLPRVGKTVYVYYGEPVPYDDLLDEPRSKETAQKVVDRVMEILRQQQEEIFRREAGERRAGPGESSRS